MAWTSLGKRNRSDDDDGGVEAEVRVRNAGGRNPKNNLLPGDQYKTNEGQRNFAKCILGLPDDVLNRIFTEVLIKDEPIIVTKNTMDLSEEVIKVVDERGHAALVPLERLGLLGTCVRFRALARPIFYVGNSFVVAVENFDAKASMAWWSKAQDIRQQELASSRVAIATTESSYSSKPKKLLDMLKRRNVRAWVQNYQKEIARGRDTAPLTPGVIRFDIEWTPEWVNLKHWLHSYHKGELPPYTLKTPDAPAQFRGIQIAFDSIKVYLHQPWLEVAKSLKIIRANLIMLDEAWASCRAAEGRVLEEAESAAEDEDDEQVEEDANSEETLAASLTEQHIPFPTEFEDSAEPHATQYHETAEGLSSSDDEDEGEGLNESDDGTITQSDGEGTPKCSPPAARISAPEQSPPLAGGYVHARETLSSRFRELSGNGAAAGLQDGDRSGEE